MDQLFAMRVFCQIVDSAGMAPAARALGVAPATVTQTLAALEKHLGVRLMNRTTRRVVVTEAGRAYYSHAERLVAGVGEADDAVRRISSSPSGNLRVTMPLGLAWTFVYPHLAAFSARYPDVQLDLQINDSVVGLVESNFDLGLRVGLLADSDCVAMPLLRYRRLTVASPEYLKRHHGPRHPHELCRHNCLRYRHALAPVHWDYRIDGKIEKVVVTGSLVSNESNALLTWARNGQGITRQPDWLVETDLKAGRLVTLLDEFLVTAEANQPGVYAILHKREYQPAKVSAFLEFFGDKIQSTAGA